MMHTFEKMKETHIVFALAVIMCLITLVPYFAGYFSAGDRFYLGVENIPDGFTYLGYAQSNVTDNLLVSQNFTTHEQQTPTLPNIYFSLVALTSKVTGIQIEIVYVALKTILLIPFIFILWHFLHEFFHTPKQRVVSLALILLGGGIGWILWGLSFINPWFARFDVTGLKYGYLSNLFSSFHHPLIFLSLSFMMIGFIILRQAIKTNSKHKAWLLNMAILSVYFTHPVDILVFVLVIGLILLIHKRMFLPYITPSLAYIGLHTTLARSDLAYRAVQDIYFTWHKTIHPAFLPIVFGVLFFLFIHQLRKFKWENIDQSVLVFWSVSCLVISFIIPAGIKMTTLAFLPIFMLGLQSLFTFSKKIQYLFALFILLGAPIILYSKISDQMLDREYISKSDATLFEKIKNDTGLVFASRLGGGILVWKTTLRPLFIDPYTTIKYTEKQADWNHFLDGSDVRNVALKYNPSYVLSEKKLDYACLDELYTSQTYYYYRIHPQAC